MSPNCSRVRWAYKDRQRGVFPGRRCPDIRTWPKSFFAFPKIVWAALDRVQPKTSRLLVVSCAMRWQPVTPATRQPSGIKPLLCELRGMAKNKVAIKVKCLALNMRHGSLPRNIRDSNGYSRSIRRTFLLSRFLYRAGSTSNGSARISETVCSPWD
jgi:hypothetical protein